jgi:peptidoglycan hydrolase FlgJ
MSNQISLSTIPGQGIDFTDQGMRTSSMVSTKQISGLKDAKINEACTEFESLFINLLLKEMRATVPKTGFISGGKAEEYYTAMLDNEFAKEIASGRGVGLASLLYEQLKGVKGQQTSKKS